MPSAPIIRTQIATLSVAYQRAGHGPALVLLHGFSHDARAWRPQVETLAEHFTIIAWDAPGAGQSSDPPGAFGIGDWADCLAGVFDHADIQRAHIVGLSWGGLLAQEFFRSYSNRVLSLVLADTYAGWKGSLSEKVARERLSACLRDSSLPAREFVPRYLPGMLSRSVGQEVREELAAIMSDFHPVGFRLMAAALAESDTRDLLPRIDVPTLLVWGEEDERSPLSIGHQLANSIPEAKLAIIPGAGHVSNLEAPTPFSSQVRDFCLSI
jgi:pimeloyl-ACP methyl ester carboxylesterase